MKRLSSDELIAALRIFNRVTAMVRKKYPDYHGKKSLGEIKDFVSSNRWIMFPVANITSLREGVNSPTPNVYIHFADRNIEDNTVGQVNGTMGMTFGNSGAMDWMWQLFKRKSNTAKFMSILNSLDDEWEVYIDHKIHRDYHAEVPTYNNIHVFSAPTVTEEDIQSGVMTSDEVLPTEDVVNAITVLTVCKETRIGSFDDDAMKVFDLFYRVLSLR